MVSDSGYKTCMRYITNHFETIIIDINVKFFFQSLMYLFMTK